MSDYTPTTDEMRRAWSFWTTAPTREEADAESGRWLAQHDAEVARDALNKAADEMPARELAISEPVRMRVQQQLRAWAEGKR